jgi:DNA-binding transcriptional LysR family regulator
LTDRNVDLVEEGFDVGFHIGDLADSRVIARPLAPYRIMICAAPDYVARRGMPAHPADLAGHEAIGLTSSARLPWSFSRDDEQVDVMPARMITVNNGQAVRAACRAGLGVVVQPEFLLRQDIEAGVLIQLLPEWDLGKRSMWLLYYRDRRMTPRILSFITFSLATFCPRVEADGSAEVPVFAR